jgi:hypothetical protein
LGFINRLLGTQNLWILIEPGHEHIGEEDAAQSHIDRSVDDGNGFGHSDPLKRLAPM